MIKWIHYSLVTDSEYVLEYPQYSCLCISTISRLLLENRIAPDASHARWLPKNFWARYLVKVE